MRASARPAGQPQRTKLRMSVIQTIEPRSSCMYNILRDMEYLGNTSVLSQSFYIIIENSSRLSDLAKIRSLLCGVYIFNL